MNALRFSLALAALFATGFASAGEITIAAAADLKFALDKMVAAFRLTCADNDKVEVIYGSSGKFFSQLQQGAPYDLFFSADIAYPQKLSEAGLTGSPVTPYAIGRLVLWSSTVDATKLTLADLTAPGIARIAIANPRHAPYGKRAEEALRAANLWDTLQPKLVYGENIAQTAQFVQTGNAQVGLIALSLAVSPELAEKGGYWLVSDSLHQPLDQGFIITKRAENNVLAKRFSSYVNSQPARDILTAYGFVLPAAPPTP